MDLGRGIKRLRLEKRLTQKELAKLAGIKQASLSQIESGKRLGEDTLEKISKGLDVSVAKILHTSLEQEPDSVPARKRTLYNELFPIIKNLLGKLVE